MKKIIQEFKEFAVKGNAIELATAVIIGGAFGKIVTSLVSDIIMPLTGLLTNGGTFSDWKITLQKSPMLTMNIGSFIQNIVDFLIIAASIFLMIKLLARLKEQLKRNKDEEEKVAPEPEPTKDQILLTEIRDLLKK
jgi:large conductance mechanosensitive channel